MNNKLILLLIVIFMLSIGTVFAAENTSDADSKKIAKSSDVTSQEDNTIISNHNEKHEKTNENLKNTNTEKESIKTRSKVWYVNPSTGTNTNTSGTLSKPFQTIKYAIFMANDSDTIHLQNGNYLLTSPCTIPKNLIIEGDSRNGVVINGNNNHYAFNILINKQLVLKNLKIINGNGGYGGAIRIVNSSSKLYVSNCQFENCVGENGGVIGCTGANTKIGINDSSFINNRASKVGGAIANTGTLSNTNIRNCIFTNNKLTSMTYNNGNNASGGAIILGGQTTNTIISCTFTGNEGFNGGAVYCAASSSTTFSSSTFTSNIAGYSNNYGYGGAIMIGNGEATFNTLTFKQNKAKRGGGISINSALVYTVSNSKFESNYAFNYGGAFNNYGRTTIQNCNFTTNQATDHGGAYFSTGTQDVQIFSNCRFITNKAVSTSTSYGGAIDSTGLHSSYTILNSVFNTNQAIRGGAISSQAQNIGWSINNSQFYNNNVSERGGAVYNEGYHCDFDIKNSVFNYNRANSIGGAIANQGTNSNIEIDQCSLTNNIAYMWGGAIINQKNTTINTRNNTYFNNKVTMSGGKGGAIYNTDLNSKLTATEENFNNNTATTGSAIYNQAQNCRINSSIILTGGYRVYSQYSLDARFNWWGTNTGTTGTTGSVNTQNRVVFQASVSNIYNYGNFKKFIVTVSVKQYNTGSGYTDLLRFIPTVKVNFNHGLASIYTRTNTSANRQVGLTISSITATLDGQPITLNLGSKEATTITPKHSSDYILNLENIDLTKENNHVILNIDNNTCELNYIFNEDEIELSYDNLNIKFINKTATISFNNKNIDHNISIYELEYDDKTPLTTEDKIKYTKILDKKINMENESETIIRQET